MTQTLRMWSSSDNCVIALEGADCIQAKALFERRLRRAYTAIGVDCGVRQGNERVTAFASLEYDTILVRPRLEG